MYQTIKNVTTKLSKSNAIGFLKFHCEPNGFMKELTAYIEAVHGSTTASSFYNKSKDREKIKVLNIQKILPKPVLFLGDGEKWFLDTEAITIIRGIGSVLHWLVSGWYSYAEIVCGYEDSSRIEFVDKTNMRHTFQVVLKQIFRLHGLNAINFDNVNGVSTIKQENGYTFIFSGHDIDSMNKLSKELVEIDWSKYGFTVHVAYGRSIFDIHGQITKKNPTLVEELEELNLFTDNKKGLKYGIASEPFRLIDNVLMKHGILFSKPKIGNCGYIERFTMIGDEIAINLNGRFDLTKEMYNNALSQGVLIVVGYYPPLIDTLDDLIFWFEKMYFDDHCDVSNEVWQHTITKNMKPTSLVQEVFQDTFLSERNEHMADFISKRLVQEFARWGINVWEIDKNVSYEIGKGTHGYYLKIDSLDHLVCNVIKDSRMIFTDKIPDCIEGIRFLPDSIDNLSLKELIDSFFHGDGEYEFTDLTDDDSLYCILLRKIENEDDFELFFDIGEGKNPKISWRDGNIFIEGDGWTWGTADDKESEEYYGRKFEIEKDLGKFVTIDINRSKIKTLDEILDEKPKEANIEPIDQSEMLRNRFMNHAIYGMAESIYEAFMKSEAVMSKSELIEIISETIKKNLK